MISNLNGFPLVSIVVPIYNAQKYLERCLVSLQKQTYSNIEVLMIDDGSTDDSGQMVDLFAEQDMRFKAFHLVNGGVSAARNYGLEFYQGEYVTFVDADDYVDEHYVEYLHKAIQESGCKMSVCQTYTTDETTLIYREPDSDVKIEIVTVDENYDYSAEYARCSVWGILFKREILGNRLFAEDIYMGEDTLFVAHALNACKKYAVIKQRLYVYILYGQSSSHGTYTQKHRTEIEAMQQLKSVYDIKHPKFCANLNARYCFSCLNGMKFMALYAVEDESWYLFLHSEVKKNIKAFMQSQYPFSRKVIAVLFVMFPSGIRKIYKLAKNNRG